MAQKVNLIVAQTSPSLYAAAAQANLKPEQITQLEQYSWTIDKNKQLSRLRVDDARKEFSGLDTKVQDMLKFLYPNAEYTKEASTVLDNTLKFGKNVVKGLASPLIYSFKALGAWNRVINTPYLMARQAEQGEGLFNAQTFTDAWDGRRVFDNGALAKATEIHGSAKVEVAKGLLAGKTPGEIIKQYGKIDDSLLEAIKVAYNDEASFKAVLDDVKYSQVSPGRDIARAIYGTKPGDIDWKTRKTSAGIDFLYQLVVDPLSWATAGTGKLAAVASKVPLYGSFVKYAGNTNGDKMIEAIKQYGTAGVKEVFEQFPDVRKHWDTEIGPAIKDFINAKGAYAKGEQFRKISNTYQGHASREWVNLLARNGIVNAESAVRYFGRDVDAAVKLLAGRVDGMQYFRNGIPTSRNQRRLGNKFSSKVRDFLNPKYSEVAGEKAWAELIKVGPEENMYVSETLGLDKFYKDIKRREKVSRLATRTPQNRSIRLGSKAVETADIFYDTARQILPVDLADMVTYKFINSNENDQVQVLRSLYYAIMQKAGLEGHAKGKELIKASLDAHFGSNEGLSTIAELKVPAHLQDRIKGVGHKVVDGVSQYESENIIHPFQEAKAIGNLDYQLIAQTAYEIRTRKNLIMAVTQGAGQHKFASDFVNYWSIFTLFPRLGMRSAIDEGVMFLLTAPAKDIFNALAPKFLGGKGYSMGKVATAATGSKHTEGFRARLLAKLGHKNISDTFSIEDRLFIREQVALDKGMPLNYVRNLDMAFGTAEEAHKFFPTGLSDVQWRDFSQALAHNSHFLSSAASSIVARASLTPHLATEVAEELLPLNNYELMLKASDVVTNAVGRVVDTKDIAAATKIGTEPLAKVHFENFAKRFYGNQRIAVGSKGKEIVFNPVQAFFKADALRTADNFDDALHTLLSQVGIKRTANLAAEVGSELLSTLGSKFSYEIADKKVLADFLTMSARTTQLRQRGIDDIDIAIDQVTRVLLDMYTTFHGSEKNFNENLLKHVNGLFRGIKKERIISAVKKGIPPEAVKDPTWDKVIQALPFKDFSKLTDGMQPKGQMYTKLDIDDMTDTESALKKLGNNMMSIMDAQVTGILRQPVIMASYLRIRENYRKLEAQQYDSLLKQQIEILEKKSGFKLSQNRLKMVKEEVNELVNKKFTEISIQQAADTVLKFVDNPTIRSNFALSVRNVGRFYRATEDFWRRMYRMKDVKLRAAYRMRLAHLGLDASGSIHEDANGDPYVMMPMDDIIFKTINIVTSTLTGSDDMVMKQPLFNDFTFKLSLSNPSFSTEAGMPALSGPIGALSVLGMKSILGHTGPTGQKIGEELDNFALGSIGEGMTLFRAVVPASLQKLYAMLPVNEKNRQEATAAMQAIAYNAAAGIAPGPNSTPEERYAYLESVRIAAHNIMFMRAALGLILPVTASPQESKDVPDYLLNVGITGLRPEFYDLVNAITERYSGDVQNPYDLAVATFVGKNPNKIIYTVSRQDKNTKVLINKTKEMKNWFIDNKHLYDAYGEAAFLFAPHVGDFDASSYAWLEGNDFIQNKELKQYYIDVMVARDKQDYFNIGRDEKIALANTSYEIDRKSIISAATQNRAFMKLANPFLEAAITGGGNEIASEREMLRNLESMVTNTDVPMHAATRSKLLILVNKLNSFIRTATDPEFTNLINITDIKRAQKADIESFMRTFMEGDLIVKEANRVVFESILNYYSRETYSATIEEAY